MREFVLDCSVALSWFLLDESDERADRVFEQLRHAIGAVPAVWPLEFANGLLVAERHGRITEADVSRFSVLARQLPIVIDADLSPGTMDRVISLARNHKLSAYDASYLELAIRKGVSIATLDSRLAAAAVSAGVRLVDI